MHGTAPGRRRASAERLVDIGDFHLGGVIEVTAGRHVLLSTKIRGSIWDGSMIITIGMGGGRRVDKKPSRLGRSELQLLVDEASR